MAKLYAIVQPAYVGSSENPLIFIDIAVILYHKMNYERICGYSLGHDVKFFNGLDDAKNRIQPEVTNKIPRPLRYTNSTYSAIIELETNKQGKITACNRIFEFDGVETRYKKLNQDDQSFVKVKVPTWSVRDITSTDLTQDALQEINRQYTHSDIANNNPNPQLPEPSAPPPPENEQINNSSSQPKLNTLGLFASTTSDSHQKSDAAIKYSEPPKPSQ